MASTSIPILTHGDEQVFSTTCAHNCGGRCIVRAHVRDGKIVKVSTDDGPWTPEMPALRACGRGMAAGHPDLSLTAILPDLDERMAVVGRNVADQRIGLVSALLVRR